MSDDSSGGAAPEPPSGGKDDPPSEGYPYNPSGCILSLDAARRQFGTLASMAADAKSAGQDCQQVLGELLRAISIDDLRYRTTLLKIVKELPVNSLVEVEFVLRWQPSIDSLELFNRRFDAAVEKLTTAWRTLLKDGPKLEPMMPGGAPSRSVVIFMGKDARGRTVARPGFQPDLIYRDLRDPKWSQPESSVNGAPKSPTGPTGFMSGAELAKAFGVDPKRIAAFCQMLTRKRKWLGTNNFQEAEGRVGNGPKFRYRAEAPKVRELVAKYQSQRTA